MKISAGLLFFCKYFPQAWSSMAPVEKFVCCRCWLHRSDELHQRNFQTSWDGQTCALNFLSEQEGWGSCGKKYKQHHCMGRLSRRRVRSNHRPLHFTFPLKSNSCNRCRKGEESNKWSGPLSLFSCLSVAWWPTELSGSIEAPWKWQQRPGLAFWHQRAISVAQFLPRKPTVAVTGY